MKIVISSGHGKYIRGARGNPVPPQLDEVDQARRVTDKVAEYLQAGGVSVKVFHDNKSTSQNANLNAIVNYHNAQSRDLDVSVHFNAYNHKAHGCEVFYLTQSSLAKKVCDAICAAGNFTNRGAKYSSNLFFLNSTEEPAILLEVCFCDNTSDSNKYNASFDAICRGIAESIGGISIGEPEEPPVEPPIDTTPPPSEEISSDNRVEITSEITDVAVWVNGTLIRGDEEDANVAKFEVKLVGDVKLVINGEDFHNSLPAEPEIADNHKGIEATVFGGSDDPNNSAYPPYALLDGDTDDFVALPYSFANNLFPHNAPLVRVFRKELSAVGRVADKGPWTTDDIAYVEGNARPIAETCFLEGSPLPSGPNAGRVPTNKAGIDLSPHLAAKIGLKGKDIVDWRFEQEAEEV
jgi:N-acetylmuramoyl-L-alanine amidase